MRTFLRSVAAMILGLCARGVILRYRPKIVMITGSVGKTSTKDAVAAVLSSRFLIRKSEKSYNSEFGVPLTIFGVKNPWGNPFAWIGVGKEILALLLLPNHYPKLLVLEVGADRPGDLAKILRIATPDAVVVTRLPDIPVHVEAYDSPRAVREEEFAPAYALAPGAPLIVSANDPFAMEMAVRTPARLISYGTPPESTIRISEAHFYEEEGTVAGMQGDVSVGKEQWGKVIVKGSIGRAQLLSATAALATAYAFGIPHEEALVALSAYEPPPGRGRLFKGKQESLIIDDSYNSSPAAVEEALDSLKKFPHAKRRIAILGDMLELGRYSVEEHERIGRLAAGSADVVVGVGIRARRLVDAAQGVGMISEKAFALDDSHVAAGAIPLTLRPGDVVLVKGSQSIRMERIVEALIADEGDLLKLVRQEKEWRRRP